MLYSKPLQYLASLLGTTLPYMCYTQSLCNTWIVSWVSPGYNTALHVLYSKPLQYLASLLHVLYSKPLQYLASLLHVLYSKPLQYLASLLHVLYSKPLQYLASLLGTTLPYTCYTQSLWNTWLVSWVQHCLTRVILKAFAILG